MSAKSSENADVVTAFSIVKVAATGFTSGYVVASGAVDMVIIPLR